MKKTDYKPLIMGIPFLAIGLALLVFLFIRIYNFNDANFIEGKGRVIDYRKSYEGDNYTYGLVIEYMVGGESYILYPDVYSYPPSKEIGEVVNIKYNPDNPKQAKIVDPSENGDLVLGICGGAFALFGLWIITDTVIKNKRIRMYNDEN